MFGLCIFFISTYLGIHTVFSDGKSGVWGKLQNLPTAGLTQNGSWLGGTLRELPALLQDSKSVTVWSSPAVSKNSQQQWKQPRPHLRTALRCTLNPHPHPPSLYYLFDWKIPCCSAEILSILRVKLCCHSVCWAPSFLQSFHSFGPGTEKPEMTMLQG